MNEITIGQMVVAKKDGIRGMLREIKEDGTVVISLKSGAVVTYPLSQVVADDTPVGPAIDGRFAPGHEYYGKNPANEKERSSVKYIQEELRKGMSDILIDTPKYIRMIPSMEKRVNAIAKIAPFCMPSLARVDVDDSGKRDLSVEQKLMEFGMQYLTGKKENK